MFPDWLRPALVLRASDPLLFFALHHFVFRARLDKVSILTGTVFVNSNNSFVWEDSHSLTKSQVQP